MLIDPPHQIVRNACIEGSRPTAHDVHGIALHGSRPAPFSSWTEHRVRRCTIRRDFLFVFQKQVLRCAQDDMACGMDGSCSYANVAALFGAVPPTVN